MKGPADFETDVLMFSYMKYYEFDEFVRIYLEERIFQSVYHRDKIYVFQSNVLNK